MAGGKETTRQKMINIMYLVLLAMLALNVSDTILNAFKNLNDSLDASKTNISSSLQQSFDSFEAVELKNKPERAKPLWDKANLAKNLSALNAVYELELQDSSAHLKSMNKFYQNLSLTMNNFNESMEDSKQFKEEVGKLAKNLSSLNAIYGNMLTAMNQPRI